MQFIQPNNLYNNYHPLSCVLLIHTSTSYQNKQILSRLCRTPKRLFLIWQLTFCCCCFVLLCFVVNTCPISIYSNQSIINQVVWFLILNKSQFLNLNSLVFVPQTYLHNFHIVLRRKLRSFLRVSQLCWMVLCWGNTLRRVFLKWTQLRG